MVETVAIWTEWTGWQNNLHRPQIITPESVMGTDKHGLHLSVACAASSFTNNNTNSHRQAKREHVNTQQLLVPSLLLWFPQPIFDAQKCLRVNEGRQKQPNVKSIKYTRQRADNNLSHHTFCGHKPNWHQQCIENQVKSDQSVINQGYNPDRPQKNSVKNRLKKLYLIPENTNNCIMRHWDFINF